MADLAIVGQDPGFAGGVLAQTRALFDAAAALGRAPELHYLRYHRLDEARRLADVRGRGVRPVVPGLEIANVLEAAAVIGARIRSADARFVCAASASNGFGAVLARKPFGCWISTSLSDEAAARRIGRTPSRRATHAASAPGLRFLERTTVGEASVRWAISPATQRSLAEAAGVPEATITVVPIPVDTREFRPLPDDEWERGLDTPELVFVGRGDDPRKNVRLLLEAFTLLRSRLPGVKLTLVGSRPATRVPEGVRALGPVGTVANVLRRASLFVLPSLQEGFGIVVAEALASGVPVLVTPCGGPEELVRESRGGEVLSGFEPEELAERAFALLTELGRLHAMRRLGRDYVGREHDPARLRAALADALEKLELSP